MPKCLIFRTRKFYLVTWTVTFTVLIPAAILCLLIAIWTWVISTINVLTATLITSIVAELFCFKLVPCSITTSVDKGFTLLCVIVVPPAREISKTKDFTIVIGQCAGISTLYSAGYLWIKSVVIATTPSVEKGKTSLEQFVVVPFRASQRIEAITTRLSW